MEQLASRWTDFYEIHYLNNFGKPVEKIKSLIKIGQE
jgi:hypothetical protein